MRISSFVSATLIYVAICASAQTSPSYTPPVACHATLQTPVSAGPRMAQYAAERNNAMAPARLAENCRDYEAAYQLYLNVLDSYPNDAAALDSTARAAALAGHDDEAISLYKRSLEPGDRYSLGVRSALMAIYIRLGRWNDFEVERMDTRAASLTGTDRTISPTQGYPIDSMHASQEDLRVLEFATLHGPDQTRDRFDLYDEKDPCTNFTPYVDLESPNPGAFRLVAIPVAGTQWLIKTYAGGEPPYQTVRADVLSALSTPLTTFKSSASCRTPAPTATNGGLSTRANR